MRDGAFVLVTLGAVLLLGLATDAIGRYTRLPRVTLLLLFGFAIGPEALGFIPAHGAGWTALVPSLALVMVGFLLGERFAASDLRRHGRFVLWISVWVGVTTVLIVFLGLLAIGVAPAVALVLAGIAPATAPAATMDVVKEARADGPFSQILLGVVAVDDAWGLVLFSLLLAAATAVVGQEEYGIALLTGFRHVVGAALLGFALGVPAAYLTGRIEPGEPSLLEALGVVLLCGGIALWLDVSFILASMVLGATVANLARHHGRPFHAIENIERPFLILFFVIGGASLRIDALPAIGVVGAGYVILRVIGRLVGGIVGSVWSGAPEHVRKWIGPALLPQAGIALGLAMVAAETTPEVGNVVLPIVVASTIVFELTGPVMTRWALRRAGESVT